MLRVRVCRARGGCAGGGGGGGGGRHAEPQLVHQSGGGGVRRVRGAHVLGHVRHRLHAALPVGRCGRLRLALPGAAAQAAVERLYYHAVKHRC